jgi:hypothetical protein
MDCLAWAAALLLARSRPPVTAGFRTLVHAEYTWLTAGGSAPGSMARIEDPLTLPAILKVFPPLPAHFSGGSRGGA